MSLLKNFFLFKKKKSSAVILGHIDFSLEANQEDYKVQLQTFISAITKTPECKEDIIEKEVEWFKNILIHSNDHKSNKTKLEHFIWHWMQQDKYLSKDFILANKNIRILGQDNLINIMENVFFQYTKKIHPFNSQYSSEQQKNFYSFIREDDPFTKVCSFYLSIIASDFFENMLIAFEKEYGVKLANNANNDSTNSKISYYQFIQDFWKQDTMINTKFINFLRWYYQETLRYYKDLLKDEKQKEIINLWIKAELVEILFFCCFHGIILKRVNNNLKAVQYMFDITKEFLIRVGDASSKSIGFQGTELEEFIDGIIENFINSFDPVIIQDQKY